MTQTGIRRNLVDVKCSQCGADLKRRPTQLRDTAFCDHDCRNAYKRGGIYITKELKDEVINLAEKERWKQREIAEFLGINPTAVWKILHGKM